MTKPRQPDSESKTRDPKCRIDSKMPGIDLDRVLGRMAEIESAFPDLGLRPIVLTDLPVQ